MWEQLGLQREPSGAKWPRAIRVGWAVKQLTDYSPWTSAHWWGRLQSRAGSACSWPGSWWYPRWAPQNPETAAYPPEGQQRNLWWLWWTWKWSIRLITSTLLSVLTSSITIIWTLSTFATPFFIKSRILPGVAMTTCTDVENRNQLMPIVFVCSLRLEPWTDLHRPTCRLDLQISDIGEHMALC